MKFLAIILTALMDIIPSGDAAIEQLQKRDSILIADQIRYSVTVKDLGAKSDIGLPDLVPLSNDTITVIGDWQLDTLVNGKLVRSKNAKAREKLLRSPFDVRASIVLAPFEEGSYQLPDLPVLRRSGDTIDTLIFSGLEMEVKTMPVDTATFVIHDIKDQINYPVTFREIAPWLALGLGVAALIALAVWLIIRARRRREEASKPKEPAYIVALKELEKYRSDKFWAPEKQKSFYSGITDTLKTYMDDRFGMDAPEMTTAELFNALKGEEDITPQMLAELRELFERADFVKFAKHVATDEENAGVLPLAVGFVTSTHQAELEKEAATGEEAEED